MDPETKARFDDALTKALNEISRCDTKAGVLLAGLSLPLAVLVATLPGREMPAAYTALVALGTGSMVVALLVVLSVVLSCVKGASPGTYLYWATCTPEQAAEDIRREPSEEALAAQVVRVSRIARSKHVRVRVAVFVTGGSLVTLAAALPAALV